MNVTSGDNLRVYQAASEPKKYGRSYQRVPKKPRAGTDETLMVGLKCRGGLNILSQKALPYE